MSPLHINAAYPHLAQHWLLSRLPLRCRTATWKHVFGVCSGRTSCMAAAMLESCCPESSHAARSCRLQ